VASFSGLSSVGLSIVRLLDACFDEENFLGNTSAIRARLVRTEDFDKNSTGGMNVPAQGVTLFLYRVDFNKATRAAWSGVGSVDGRAHLPLDLHFLLTPWATNAEHELKVLGKAMECLERQPILSGPLLNTDGGFATNEAVQIVLEDVETEAIMRTFDSLPIDFKISVPYVARVLRLDSRETRPDPKVRTVIRGVHPTGGGVL
jgi:hypothetical protein